MAKKKKYYTVWNGRTPGVYSSWDDCEIQIHGYEGAIYKSFTTLELAEEAFKNESHYYIGDKTTKPSISLTEIEKLGTPIKDSICVDGAWNTKTNAMEYQGVEFPSLIALFHAGPFKVGTNNIAEFLAIVHALAYCKEKRLGSVIYSDSRTAISWVKRKKAATKIVMDESTSYIRSVVQRAESWLHTNEFKNQILKWETTAWGENPADFGRK